MGYGIPPAAIAAIAAIIIALAWYFSRPPAADTPWKGNPGLDPPPQKECTACPLQKECTACPNCPAQKECTPCPKPPAQKKCPDCPAQKESTPCPKPPAQKKCPDCPAQKECTPCPKPPAQKECTPCPKPPAQKECPPVRKLTWKDRLNCTYGDDLEPDMMTTYPCKSEECCNNACNYVEDCAVARFIGGKCKHLSKTSTFYTKMMNSIKTRARSVGRGSLYTCSGPRLN